MGFLSIITTLAFSVSTSAFPLLLRQAPTTCSNLGGGLFDSGGPYTLLAVATSNPNGTGIPLVLSPPIGGPPFEDPGALSVVTADTFTGYGYSTFSLEKGFLSSNNGTNTAFGTAAYYAGPVNFNTEDVSSFDSFCAQVGTSPAGHNPPHPLLTIYNSVNDFSLCKSTSAEFDGPLNALILRPSNDTSVPGLYDFDSCYGVDVYLVDA